MKRFTAWVLTMVMVANMLPFQAFAAEGETAEIPLAAELTEEQKTEETVVDTLPAEESETLPAEQTETPQPQETPRAEETPAPAEETVRAEDTAPAETPQPPQGEAPAEALPQETLPAATLPEEDLLVTLEDTAETTDAETPVAQGSCGTDVAWALYDTDANGNGDRLVISGSGAMGDFGYDSMPWYSYSNVITDVVIEEGVTSVGEYAFYKHVMLKSVQLPEGVTEIGERAFYECAFLEEIQLPDSITTIESESFYNCTSLKEINIPDSVTSIPSWTFSRCSNLEKVHINSIEKWLGIGFGASDGNPLYSGGTLYIDGVRQTKITVPAGITEIKDYAFYNCDALEEVIIPEGVTNIGSYAFYSCKGLKKVTIPAGITEIKENTFNNCEELEEVIIPEGVTYIGASAFHNCYSAVIYVPKTATAIKENAFRYVKRVDFAGTVAQWDAIVGSAQAGIAKENIVFNNDYEFTYTLSGNKATVTGLEDTVTGVLRIPDTIDGYDVVAIAPNAFKDRTDITGIITGEKLETIGKMAFYGAQLRSVQFGSGLQHIGDYAFYNAFYKEYEYTDPQITLEFAEGMKTVGKNAFAGVDITELKIPSTMESIGIDAFEYYSYATPVTYNGTLQQWLDICRVESLDNYRTAYLDSKGGPGYAKYMDYNGKVSEEYVLMGWPDARGAVEISAQFRGLPVKYIYTSAFKNCTEMTSVKIPDSITRIDENAFGGCTGLTEITIPESVTSLGSSVLVSSVFNDCTNLKTADIKANIWIMPGYCFSGCTSLETVYLPYTLSSIEQNAFEECFSLTDVYFDSQYNWENKMSIGSGNTLLNDAEIHFEHDWGYSISSFGSSSGSYKGLYILGKTDVPANLVIPETLYGLPVKIIDERAFENCTGITGITIGENMRLNSYCFAGCTGIRNIVFKGVNSDYFDSSVFEGVPRNAKVSVAKDSSAHRCMIDMGFTNFETIVVLQHLYMNSTVVVPKGGTAQVKVNKQPADAKNVNLQWTVADETIATVSQTGLVTGKNMGETILTVTDTNTGITARTTINVVMPYTDKLTVTLEPQPDALGLQTGQSTRMVINSTSMGPLDPSMFYFSSSDDTVATIEADGTITAVNTDNKAISVKFTARLKNDPNNRTVYTTVKIIPVQTATLELYTSGEETDGTVVVVPKTKVAEAPYSFDVYSQALSGDGVMTAPVLKWTTSNAKVAAVKDGVVTIPAKADGIATITATATDLGKQKAVLVVDVRDYTPRLEKNTITLNTNTVLGAQLRLIQAYDAVVTDVNTDNSEYFTATYDADTGIVYIDTAGIVPNGTYKLNLVAQTTKGEFSAPVTIKVSNKLPAITVKQASTFNLFMKDATADVVLTAKNEVITDVLLTDTDTFTSVFDSDTGALTLAYAYPYSPETGYADGKPDLTATMEIYVENYPDPVIKTLKIKAKETKPVLVQSAKNTKLSPLTADGAVLKLTEKATGRILTDRDVNITLAQTSEGYVDLGFTGAEIALTPVLDENYKFANGKTSHTAKFDVQADNWLKPVTVTHTVAVNAALPTLKAGKAVLTLNPLFDGSDFTVFTPSATNCPQPAEYIITPVNAAQAEQTDKISITTTGWTIRAEFKDIDNLPANGSYKYTVVPVVAGADGLVELKAVTITVKVAAVTPKATLAKTAIRLNKNVKDTVALPVKLTRGYEMTDMLVENGTGNRLTDAQLTVAYNLADNAVTATVLSENVPNGTYLYTLTPVARMTGLTTVKTANLKPLTLKVTVYAGIASITASGKGSIDLIDRENGIVYTITGGKNFNYNVNDIHSDTVVLTGADADKFTADYIGTNEKGQPQIMVKAREDVAFSTKTTYTYSLLVGVDGFRDSLLSAVYKVKPKQTALKLNTAGDMVVYQSSTSGEVTVSVAKPEAALIKTAEILRKGTTVPAGSMELAVENNPDGTVTLRYTVKDPSLLKVNSTCRIALAITPVGNATDKTATTVNVSLKIKR